MAKRRGAVGEFHYPRGRATMFVEFVGVVDLLELGVEADPDEVWWELTKKMKPMERRRQLILPDSDLIRMAFIRRRPRN